MPIYLQNGKFNNRQSEKVNLVEVHILNRGYFLFCNHRSGKIDTQLQQQKRETEIQLVSLLELHYNLSGRGRVMISELGS